MLKITQHAYNRAKERCGLKRKSLDRIIDKAYKNGLARHELKGNLHKWVTAQYYHDDNKKQMIIYGEYLFIFSSCVLITIYSIPVNLRKTVKAIMEKRK